MAIIKDLVEIGKQLNHIPESQAALTRRYDRLHVSWYNDKEETKNIISSLIHRLDTIELALQRLQVLPKKRWWR